MPFEFPILPTWLSRIAVGFSLGATHQGQPWTPALTLPHLRYGLRVLRIEVFGTFCMPSMCRHARRQFMRHELARFYHYRTRNCIPPRKLRRDIP